MKVRVIIGCLTIALAVGGCGGGNSAPSSQVSAQLVAEVGRITTAAQAHDVATTTARLADLRKSVLLLRSQDDLSDAAATRILNAADVVQADLGLLAPSTTTSTSSTTTATTATTAATKSPPPPAPAKKHHGKGHGDG
jgi:hypothetical protein